MSPSPLRATTVSHTFHYRRGIIENPVAKQYFDDTLQGLASGEKSLAELRADAIDARRKLRDLRSFLGPGDAVWLENYGQVLDRFIEQSAQIAE